MGRGAIVGLSYTDAPGLRYTTVASQYGTRVLDGNAMSELKLYSLAHPRRLS